MDSAQVQQNAFLKPHESLIRILIQQYAFLKPYKSLIRILIHSHRKEYSHGRRPRAAVRLLEAVQKLDPQSVAGAAQLHKQHHPREEARGGEADGAAAEWGHCGASPLGGPRQSADLHPFGYLH
jgi:hypothetical protein